MGFFFVVWYMIHNYYPGPAPAYYRIYSDNLKPTKSVQTAAHRNFVQKYGEKGERTGDPRANVKAYKARKNSASFPGTSRDPNAKYGYYTPNTKSVGERRRAQYKQ